ncbi:MAG: stage II sporulation protein P [Lachnospiraceae bacterium]|nr:stage II sporulation protein P [Lachnospiraceae bacterium]
MRRHAYYRRGHKNHYNRNHSTGSIIISVVIYGLFVYLIVTLFNISINKTIRQNVMGNIAKQVAAREVGIIGYVSVKDNRILSSHNDHIAALILGLLSDPVTQYNEKNVAVGIANAREVTFFLDNRELGMNQDEETGIDEQKIQVQNEILNNEESDGINSEKTAGNSKEDGTVENHDGDNGNSGSDADQSNERRSNDNEKAEESENNVTVANMDLNKKKEIKVSDLTYEYMMKNFYTVVSSTTLKPEDINAEKLMNINMKLSTKSDQPQILIYHTHGQEGFTDSVSGNPETGIVGVGNYLVDLLRNQYGYNVIHITDSFDYVNGVFDRSKAYDYAYERIASVLAENPSIEVVIDLHRDGVGEQTHLVTEVNGKPTAQIMFFNGISRLNSIGEIGYLYNPYRTENLAMSLQMKVLAEEYFEGFTRRNYIQAYQYNLHMRPKSMLIEAGAQTNSFEEVKNAMEPLAALLHMCIGDAN